MPQCSNWHRNLVPDESGSRFAWLTYQKPTPEKWGRLMALVSGVCVIGLTIQCCPCVANTDGWLQYSEQQAFDICCQQLKPFSISPQALSLDIIYCWSIVKCFMNHIVILWIFRKLAVWFHWPPGLINYHLLHMNFMCKRDVLFFSMFACTWQCRNIFVIFYSCRDEPITFRCDPAFLWIMWLKCKFACITVIVCCAFYF